MNWANTPNRSAYCTPGATARALRTRPVTVRLDEIDDIPTLIRLAVDAYERQNNARADAITLRITALQARS